MKQTRKGGKVFLCSGESAKLGVVSVLTQDQQHTNQSITVVVNQVGKAMHHFQFIWIKGPSYRHTQVETLNEKSLSFHTFEILLSGFSAVSNEC
jgi:hypothetical protein